jgi:hypothetical protein
MFILKKIVNGRMNVPEPEYLPTKASTSYTEGQALVLSSGKLVAASGTTKPTHISMKNYTAPATGNLDLPVMRIERNMVFLVEGTGTVGSKLTVDGCTDVATIVENVSDTHVHVIIE